MAELPTKEELAKLPLRAAVAYAVRCARRVQPLYRLAEDDPDVREHMRNIERALQIAEVFAAGRIGGLHSASALAAARAATNDVANDAAAAAAAAAAEAAEAAEAARAAARAVTDDAVEAAAAAAAARAFSTVGDYAADISDVRRAAMRDYQRLVELDLGKPGQLGERIDATETGPLGPLWPEGPPDWFVEGLEWQMRILVESESESTDVPPISVYIDPGSAPEELITEFYLALSAAYAAHGGSGLRIVNEERRAIVGEELT